MTSPPPPPGHYPPQYEPPYYPPPQYQPPYQPQRTSRAFANWGIGTLAFVLTAIAVMAVACCFGSLWVAGKDIEKDQQQTQGH